MTTPYVTSSVGILTVLAGTASFFFYLEKRTGWKFFEFIPPLCFIYAVPMLLSTQGVLPNKSPVYDQLSHIVMPMFLVLMLINVNVVAAVRVMGRGLAVMLIGTAGIVLGAPIALLCVKHGLGPDAWKTFGVLAGSWIGGTGNMGAMQAALNAPPESFGLAALADALIYIIWLPILLGSKSYSAWFNRFAKVDPKRIELLENASQDLSNEKEKIEVRHILYLISLGLGVSWLASTLANFMPIVEPILTTNSWNILLITTFGIALSTTRARNIPGSHEIAVALLFLFVANMGAKADLRQLTTETPWFLLGAAIWITIHGCCCVLGAKILHVDVHSTAIASAANIGGIASATIVAACHNEKLVPVSILMALIGYAVGNYGAMIAAILCRWVS